MRDRPTISRADTSTPARPDHSWRRVTTARRLITPAAMIAASKTRGGATWPAGGSCASGRRHGRPGVNMARRGAGRRAVAADLQPAPGADGQRRPGRDDRGRPSNRPLSTRPFVPVAPFDDRVGTTTSQHHGRPAQTARLPPSGPSLLQQTAESESQSQHSKLLTRRQSWNSMRARRHQSRCRDGHRLRPACSSRGSRVRQDPRLCELASKEMHVALMPRSRRLAGVAVFVALIITAVVGAAVPAAAEIEDGTRFYVPKPNPTPCGRSCA